MGMKQKYFVYPSITCFPPRSSILISPSPALCLTTQLAEYHWDKQQEVSTNRKQTKEIGYNSCSGVSLWFRLLIAVSPCDFTSLFENINNQ